MAYVAVLVFLLAAIFVQASAEGNLRAKIKHLAQGGQKHC